MASNPVEPFAEGDALLCPDCGYDLRARSGPCCPECGLALDFLDPPEPLIPWERRPGSPAAYCQTVARVLATPRLFARAVFGPVSHRAAQGFRWVTVAGVASGVAACFASGELVGGFGLVRSLYDLLGPEIPLILGLCWLLTAALGTGTASYLFHPRSVSVRRQNRAVALSYYALAPFAVLIPLFWCAAPLFGLIEIADNGRAGIAALLLGAVLAAALAYWLLLARFAAVALPRTDRPWLLLLLPLLQLALLLFGGVIVPGALVLFALVWVSLR